MTTENSQEIKYATELIEKYHLNTQNFSSDRNSILLKENHVIRLSIQGTTDHYFLKYLPYFSFLEELYLYQNGLTQIPDLSNCHSLKKLGLGGNKITHISGLDSLTLLTDLELGRNIILKIEGLAPLTQLKNLNLSWNKIAVIENLQKLENLRSLNLMNNQIREMFGLTYQFNLESLNLRGNWITEIAGLENCRKLKNLNLAYNRLEKIDNIGHLSYLEEFDIEGNPLLPEYEANVDQPGQFWVNKCRLPTSDQKYKILSFIGYSDSGKTASIEALISYLHQSGRKCFAFKKIHKEGVEFDTPGKNTYRFGQAGASIVGGQTDQNTGLFFNWVPPVAKLIDVFTSFVIDELCAENEPIPIIFLEGYREIGDKQILCVSSYEEIKDQISSRVIAFSGAINQYKDAIEKAEKEYNIPVINCLKNPERVIELIEN
jgi:molybdopterin-guanine dinucleotide biosynthesis protein MobB